jgi:RHS repeat-associated protein
MWVSNHSGIALSPLTPQSQGAVSAATNRLTASTYDDAGNQTVDGQDRTFAYDAENRQIKFNGTAGQYFYDGDGHRVKKIEGSGPSAITTVFVYNVSGQLIAEYTTASPPGGGTSYLTTDHLGSTRVVTSAADGGGNVTVKARYDYLPFGEEIPSTIGSRSTVTGYGGADETRQKFTQKERDSESGLDYFLARYHSPAQGRFSSADPIYFQKEMLIDPQRFNLYGYVRCNPLRYIDPSGMILQISAQGDPERVKAWLLFLANEFGDRLRFVEVKDTNGNVIRYDVTFNVSESEITKSEGARFVYDLVNSDKVFFAQAGGEVRFKSKGDKKGIIHTRSSDKDPGNITRNRPGPSGVEEPADPTVDSIVLVSPVSLFVDESGEEVQPVSFFIHEAAEAYLLAKGKTYAEAHGFRYGQFEPSKGFRKKYLIPWDNAISREARIRLELSIKGGFAGGNLRRKK